MLYSELILGIDYPANTKYLMLDNYIHPIEISKAFPGYISVLFNVPFDQLLSPLLIGLTVILLLAGLGLVLFTIFRFRKTIAEQYVFLEIKPTDTSLKSPLSTNELYTILHSFGRHQTFLSRLIGYQISLSFELVASKQTGIRYIVRTPLKEASLVKKTLLAYLPGIEIKETTDCIEQISSGMPISIKEMTFKNPFVYPLENQTTLNQHDPIAYSTAYMTKLKDDEQVFMQFICSSVQEATHRKIVRYLKELNELFLENQDISRKIHQTEALPLNLAFGLLSLLSRIVLVVILLPFTAIDWFLDKDNHAPLLAWWVLEGTKSKRLSEIGAPKMQLYQSVQEKINQPLFDTTIRLIVLTQNQKSNNDRLNGLISSFDGFTSSKQSFLPVNSSLLILHNRLFDRAFYYLLQKRLSLLKTNVILSVSELSALYHFPYTDTTQTEDLLKTKSPQLPPPLSLKKTDTKFDIAFAKNKYGETETIIGQTLEERRRHTYMIGATGTGKTTLLLQMIYQDMEKGKGLAVIDPHGDLSKRLLEVLPKDRIKDVVYFNPYDIEYPVCLNFLELPKNISPVEKEREKEFLTSSLISVFHKLYDARYSGPRMEHILRNVILTALELEEPTLFTIYKLLTDTKYRKQVTNGLTDEVLKTFWKNEFGAQGSYQRAEQISPITNKLGRFLTTTLTRNILNQHATKLDFSEIMDNKKILLCDLSKGKIGEDNSFFLGSLIIAKLELAAFRRINVPEKDRVDFFLYVDEFQNFATVAFAQVLSEARKYRLSAILAHQNTVQLENDLLDTIIGNSGTIISFRTSSPKDESKIAPIFAPQVESGQIANLPSYHFYIKINALEPQDAFTGEIDDFTMRGDTSTRDKIIESSRAIYATKMEIKNEQKAQVTIKRTVKNNENKFEAVQ